MRCDEIRTILEDCIDGNATPESKANAAEHLASCERCASEERAIRSLKSRAAALPDSIEPVRDLWSGIEAGLGSRPPRRASFLRPALMAASLAAVIAGAGYVWRATMPSAPALVANGESVHTPDVLPAMGFGSSSLAAPGLGGAELAFVEAKQQLRTALYEKRKSLSPETLKTVDQELKVIENAIVEIRIAVERDPGNRELQKMFVATREREVALLRHMTQTADLRSR